MHYHIVEDKDGDTVDAIPYCSDFCNKEGEGDKYRGWNGCHEGADYDQVCANCGEKILGLDGIEKQAKIHTTEKLQALDDEQGDNYHYQLTDGEQYRLTDEELGWLDFVRGRYCIADHLDENIESGVYTVDTIGLGEAMEDDGMFPKIVMLSEDSVLHRIAFFSATEPD